jgi:type IV pilus assembly protein PilA
MKRIAILAVLLAVGAVACSKGGSSSGSSEDRAAQSALRNAVAAAQTCFVANNSYTGCESSELSQIEPSLTFVDGLPSVSPEMVSIAVLDGGQAWAGAVASPTGTCFTVTISGDTALSQHSGTCKAGERGA